ncbi:MAG TPA: LPS assembly protein LptD [Candidatus Binatia bacterium]|nr:LPS assembly protein LptD [Candidatus Binatia bacterium]
MTTPPRAPGFERRSSRTAGRWALGLVAVALLAIAWPGLAPAQPSSLTLAQDGEDVTLVADRLQEIGGDSRIIIAEGDVEMTRGGTRLLADRIEYNRDTGEAVALGRVIFFDGQDRLVGERVDYNVRTGTGIVHAGSAFSAPYYYISGERMERIGEGVYQVRRGVFTTCEGDEPAWAFRMGEATADVNDSVVGRDVSFWVHKIPLIPWFPYFAAAVRKERESGFLFPTTGFSSRRGFMLKVPFFWAIDDSQDLTLAPEIFSERGMGLSGEYRYILSEAARGALGGFYVNEFLRSDDDAINIATPVPRDRWWVTGRHEWAITDRLAFKADILVTSDDQIFRDYGQSLAVNAAQFAPSFVSLTRRWDAWNLVGFGYYYQDLTTTQPVELQRLPQIDLRGILQPVPGIPRLLYEVRASAVNFVREEGSEGVRLDLFPVVRMPIPIFGSFTVTPFLGGRLTWYDTQVAGYGTKNGILLEETIKEGILRQQIEIGFEATARAARVYQAGGFAGIAALQHVIEPRVGFAAIRGRNQDQLPQWDPTIDRIGTTNGITYSLTNRLNAKTVAGANQEPVRWELLRFVLSQTVSATPDQPQRFQDMISELIIQPNQIFSFRGVGSWNFYGAGLRALNTDIFASWRGFTVGVGTRYNDIPTTDPLATQLVPGLPPTVDGGLSQVIVPAPPTGTNNYVTGMLSGRILPNLGVRASTGYDVGTGEAVEVRIGVDFVFQCWAFLLEYVNRPQSDRNEVRVAVNLLGLGQVGTGVGLGGP